MTIKLSYFDFNGGRGEDCRLALHIAGVDFVDDRIPGREWPARKEEMPFHNMPALWVDGASLGQSNAILVYLGRKHGMHPTDLWEAAKHEALMNACEELRHQVSSTFGMKGDELKAAREALASGYLKRWGGDVEATLGEGPFASGEALNVVDLKLFVVVKWFTSGALDHIPTDVFAEFPKLMGIYEAVRDHGGVKGWYANR